jgi:hypothetical protein
MYINSNCNYLVYYRFLIKMYIFSFISSLLIPILYELKFDDYQIVIIYLTFILWYFNILSLDKILIFLALLYIMYENGIIHNLQQKLNDKYYEYVKNIHENTGMILAEFKSSNKQININAFDKNFDNL